MSEGYFKRVTQYTPTRMWINNPTLSETNKAIAAGAVSCTTNPTYCGKMLANPEMRDIVLSLIGEGCRMYSDASDIAAFAQRKSVKLLMDKFLPVYEAAGGVNGFVSLQGVPFKEDDPANIINEALKDLALGKNFIAKIPTTEAGLEAIKYLCARNVPVIATDREYDLQSDTSGYGTMTLSLPTKAAIMLVQARTMGNITYLLRNMRDTKTEQDRTNVTVAPGSSFGDAVKAFQGQ